MKNTVAVVTAEPENALQEVGRRTTALAMQLGYEGDLSIGSLEDGIRLYQGQAIHAFLELGKRLLILKERTVHGEFEQRIDMLGFSIRSAQKIMSATLKFSKTNTSALLEKVGSKSKLLELMTLDDDEVDLISQGVSIGEVNLDSIETMSVRELKKALRDAKTELKNKDLDAESQAKIIASKDQKINELDTSLNKLQNPANAINVAENMAHQLEVELHSRLHQSGLTLLNAVLRYQNEINALLDSAAEFQPILADDIALSVNTHYQRIAQVSTDLGIQIDFNDMVNPAWELSSHSLQDQQDTDTPVYEHQGLEG